MLRLAGVSGYEGTICHDRSPDCLAQVIGFLDRLRELTVTLIDAGSLPGTDPVVLSAGGSAFFDLVVDRIRGRWDASADVRVVLRSGCYVTHDAGIYERVSPLPSRDGARGFQPAMELWSHVVSRPEPELAILGFGKRDVSFDIDLPYPRVVRRGSGASEAMGDGLQILELNDQHAYGQVRPGFALEVGDRVGLGICHPCTSFDKWRAIPVVGDDERVVDAVTTHF